METFNLATATKSLYDSGREVFTLKALRDILNFPKESSFFSLLRRLSRNKVLTRVERGKYVLAEADINLFKLANFIYAPSYVSLESALNFHGVLPQFPVEQTSVTIKKSKQKEFEGKLFSYARIKRDLFWGYKKVDGFLIAGPEKALLDQVYLMTKGIRRVDLNELEWSRLNKKILSDFSGKYNQIVKEQISKINREF